LPKYLVAATWVRNRTGSEPSNLRYLRLLLRRDRGAKRKEQGPKRETNDVAALGSSNRKSKI